MIRALVLLTCLLFLIGCGGSSSENATTSTKTASSAKAGAKTASSDKGVGPITHVDIGPIDEALAAKGKEIFDIKCAVCHKIEERYVGPALAGVTERRKPEWIMNMILNPERMIQEDEQAKALFVEFLTPMANQSVEEADAKAILTYLRSVDAGATE